MASNDTTDALVNILDSVEIIHAVIKWEVFVPIKPPSQTQTEPFDTELAEIFRKLHRLQETVHRRCKVALGYRSVNNDDGDRGKGEKMSRNVPSNSELDLVNGWLDIVLRVITEGKNEQLPLNVQGYASLKPHTEKQLKKILKRLNNIVVKYNFVSFGDSETRGTGCKDSVMKKDEKPSGKVDLIETAGGDKHDEKPTEKRNSVPGKEIRLKKDIGVQVEMQTEKNKDKPAENRDSMSRTHVVSKAILRIQQLEQEVRDLTIERDKSMKEKDALQTRLSQVMSVQLTNNNPNIADLGDALRPTVIAEKFGQLYDDEWTDGLLTLQKSGLDERQSLQKLWGIIQDSYKFCLEQSGTQSEKVVNALISFESKKAYNNRARSPKIPADLDGMARHSLNELRRHTGTLSKETLINEYCEQNPEANTGLTLYIEKCLELCWYMVLQSPPVCMDARDLPKRGSNFNKDVYKFYTKSGSKLDFLVWPPLFLHDGGPMLAKGVAQPIR